MPYISTKVNVKISKEKEDALKARFGQAISIFPGKSETYLMLSFEDECSLYFGGKNNFGIAFVDVKLFGRSDNTSYDKMTAEVTKIINEELGISPSSVYVKYEEVDHWGWNGKNF